MSIKTYRPTTPARRQMTVSGFDGVDKHARPEKKLTEVLKKNSGRNSYGRITVRHQGGGNRKKYRVIDFKRDKMDVPATVLRLEYDPNRSAYIALVEYTDGERRYILAPVGLNVGDTVLSSAAADITAMVQEGTGEANAGLEAAEQKIYAIRRGRSAQSMATIQVVLQEVMEHLAELSAQGGKTLPGLSTGFSAVDGKINGLNKSDLLLLAARPGMGKTSMALNVALNAAKESGQTVAVFSLEMSRDQLVTRLLASEGLIENTRLISGDLRESDWVKIAEGASSLSRLDIRIDDNPLLTVADMNAKCRRIDNLGLVVIDYLQLMTSAGGKGYSGENRQQAVSDISRMLKIMAKELKIPLIALSQLSRQVESRTGKRPQLSDLRESGAIEQDADVVMFIYRDDYYNHDTDKKDVAEIIIAKQRNGPIGTIELAWLPNYTKFANMEK